MQVAQFVGLAEAHGSVEGVRYGEPCVRSEVDSAGLPLLCLAFRLGDKAACYPKAVEARMDIHLDQFGLGFLVCRRGNNADTADNPLGRGEGLGRDPKASSPGGIVRGDRAEAGLLTCNVEDVAWVAHPTLRDE